MYKLESKTYNITNKRKTDETNNENKRPVLEIIKATTTATISIPPVLSLRDEPEARV